MDVVPDVLGFLGAYHETLSAYDAIVGNYLHTRLHRGITDGFYRAAPYAFVTMLAVRSAEL
jgi:hypothetical protein